MLQPCPRCGGYHPTPLSESMDAGRQEKDKNKSKSTAATPSVSARRSSRTKKNETPADTASSSSSSTSGPTRKGRSKTRHNPMGASTTTTTSTTTIENKELLESFRCSICLELFYEPVTLSCGHNFCKLCSLGRLIRNCPLCKSEVNNVVALKVNSTLKSLVQQFFPQEYLARENRWKEENDQWSEDVLKALEGGKLLTESELYEGFRQNLERRKGSSPTAKATDLPTRQQFLYFLAHMKKSNRVLVLKGKPFFWFDPRSLDLSNLLDEFMRKRNMFPIYMSKKKWQQNWCFLVTQKLKEIDEKLYTKAKEVMDTIFDEFDTVEEFNENTPSTEPHLSSMSGYFGMDPYSSDETDSDISY
eukprot:TRINITY_DN6637_c0_g1_i1.p1 TRINITY_DN6637_c0_g1~~TRINITY_DN6637_c0_g1_i1.p1  ORF type:complete len:360 (+),score=63.57 TRINITY_DN6637_c0_g1_i1:37-1116(+)